MNNKLKDGLYYVGVKDPLLRKFDIVCDTEFGTTYNAYLIKDKKNVLIETVNEKFLDEYISSIEEIIPITSIDYLICNHTEPDHSGSVRKILELNPNITVIASTAGLRNLAQITNMEFKQTVAKNGDTLNIGKNDLVFNILPNLHWPDTMMTYAPSLKVLFSCDVFGAHYCENGITDENLMYPEKYFMSMKDYYLKIVHPFRKFVKSSIPKLDGMEFDMVCNSHGPVVVKYIEECRKNYMEWSNPVKSEKKKIAVVYASVYGYTKLGADAILNALIDYDVELIECDVLSDSHEEIMKEIDDADALIIGTTTINRNAPKPIWDVVTDMDLINASGKMFYTFGSYGWSGEGTALISSALTGMRLKQFDKPFTFVFRPTDEDLENLSKNVCDLADKLIANEK